MFLIRDLAVIAMSFDGADATPGLLPRKPFKKKPHLPYTA
jgi:hypothetical protein